MVPSKLKGRSTKFNIDILSKKDENGDTISSWCRQGIDGSGFCIVCNHTIKCTQHGIAVIKRHATSKRHIEAAKNHRDSAGVLKTPKTYQTHLDFSQSSATLAGGQVVRAETLFVLGITLKEVPFSWADTATSLFPGMFPDSEIAKQFSCKRTKASYKVSDGLESYFRRLVMDELNRPNVFYSIAIDEMPLPEQHCQQLDVMRALVLIEALLRKGHIDPASQGAPLLAQLKDLQDKSSDPVQVKARKISLIIQKLIQQPEV
ncbi:hypothetical protein V5799_010734 [Amblyomma americanum]|uniref:Uncharacterized protein n=1 Tax=Amblyomma americanum TaxID=6943 RepID=A0AAQ4EJ39_AMBAM